MDKALQSRELFIGGSEASMIYANYSTKTFKEWWNHKLTELPKGSFSNKAMSVGTILEGSILDLYEEVHGVSGERDKQSVKGFARASTDYILGDKVSDVKATKNAFEWFLKGSVPINYKRQLIHYIYVLGLSEASIIAYQVDENLLNNPFQTLDKSKLFEIPVKITDADVKEHAARIEFLEHCKAMNVIPESVKWKK